ncbi:mitogen-activated protein kinase kinase kinase 15-like isoform X3 [Varroa jacobsoni]|uniref:mitogen-activated protein kinase kinase kinase n=1 Tax=Varroa destructor TaxID=109461 RepID=A0A7M7JHH5_VARDE|nr:mitogen-activated protein kinase kinase kinase 15-like isoform X3 [Varroa destructor]XP_022706259.1 mitogen-activated protein kinase kinase kinase 15-like isoform X3 [Varroa jacobsoni]
MLKRKCHSHDDLATEPGGHSAKRASVAALTAIPGLAASSGASGHLTAGGFLAAAVAAIGGNNHHSTVANNSNSHTNNNSSNNNNYGPNINNVTMDYDKSQGSSTATTVAKMEVVLLIDLETRHPEWGDSSNRLIAQEEIRRACRAAGATLRTIDLRDLGHQERPSGEIQELFYQADVAIVDITIRSQWNCLFYHLGIRESFRMVHSIVIGNASSKTGDHKSQLGNYRPIYYCVADNERQPICYVSEIGPSFSDGIGIVPVAEKDLLCSVIKKRLLEFEVNSKEFLKEKFMADLRQLRESHRGDELKAALKKFRLRLDDPNVISPEVVHKMLNALNDAQDYDSSAKLVEDLQEVPTLSFMHHPAIQYLYAFALNRRKREGDTDRALAVMEKALERKENEIPDYLGLCGRIYKDKYLNSDCKDTDSLKKAIEWYRKGFDAQQSVYNGINLATLLTADGHRPEESHDLQYVFLVLNNLIGKKGEIDSMTDYWDVATYFEVCYLVENYTRAIQVAAKMFHLNPASWCLETTLLNIQLIARKRRKGDTSAILPEEHIMGFWIDYFSMATKETLDDTILFPAIINEPSEQLMPAEVTLHLDTGDQKKYIQISHKCAETLRGNCKRRHDWNFTSPAIKGVSLYRQDDRCILLYVHENSDDFQMFFPSSTARKRFYQVVQDMISENQQNDEDAMCHAFDYDSTQFPCVEFEYDLDESGHKKVLGKGTYGVVYAATDIKKMTQIAVKEIPEKNLKDVQPLHEEIMLHMHLRHKNIVQYLGSKSENGVVKICMERVPGGSLSHLLRFNWGPLRNESTIAHYTRQILEGIKYLHKNNIVHRDIKGDNVLINTYSGIVKISDFGTSKRMVSGRLVETFAGTFQYMAPEVMDNGDRGYGKPADIWSLGCTVIEMATGKFPFSDLPPQAALFKVGQFKIHPDIPETLTEVAKTFIENCFTPDPDKRATAEDLLADIFLDTTQRKKRQRPTGPPLEIPRSMSVPYGSLAFAGGGRMTRFASTGDEGPSKILASPTSESVPKSPGTYSYSSGLLSPPVDGGPLNGVEETAGFYMLKKDSQRRQTIVKVMQEDKEQLLSIWMDRIRGTLSSASVLLISEDHLKQLLSGIIAYVPAQDKGHLSRVLAMLKELLDYDGQAVSQLQTALFVFQQSVMEILQIRQNIKPHWMFALDNLVKQCCQAAISILSPELAANISGHNIEEEDDDGDDDRVSTTSGVSTSNSIRSAAQKVGEESPASHLPSNLPGTGDFLRAFGQLGAAQEKTAKYVLLKGTNDLVNTLVQSEKLYQDLLVSLLQSRHHQRKFVQDVASDSTALQQTPHVSHASQESIPGTSGMSRAQIIKEDGDPLMVQWLEDIGLDEESVLKFVKERFTIEDVLQLVDRDDLKRLGLKLGYEVRVWTAIQRHRSQKD